MTSRPQSRSGYHYALVCIDFISRYMEIQRVRRASAATFAEWLRTGLIPRHGCPTVVTSDRG